MYVAYTGAVSNQAELEIIANNIANAGTTGYRRDQTQFGTILSAAMPFVTTQPGPMDMSPGAHQLTKNPLHAAIDGDGFFAVQREDGSEFYTRAGNFRLNAAGELTLANGLRILGEGGSLTVPSGEAARLQGDGSLVTNKGELGRLKIVRFQNPADLRKIGQGLIAAGPGAGLEEVQNKRIAVGFLEASNVNLAAEMVAMMQASRSFEAAMRSVRINDELTQRLIQAQN